MSQPEIALLLSSYQRPDHLRRSLESIAQQRGVEGRIELIVTDDGSTDETPQVVADFARQVPFRVEFVTHPHNGFQLSRCRNEGVRASRAPYLLFLDGDCVLPNDHVRIHLQHRQPGVVMAGDCARLDEDVSARVTMAEVRAGSFVDWAPASEKRRLRKAYRSSLFYRLIRHPTKPKLIGNNVGIWREDYERINGYDENFQGWGCEDDDLRFRLRQAGVQVQSILRWTCTYHLWHPRDVTAPGSWKQGANVQYLLRKGRLTRCLNGLQKRSVADLRIHVVGETSRPHLARQLTAGRFAVRGGGKPEVELLFLPGAGKFSGHAECNVLVSLEPAAATSSLEQQAHLTIAPSVAGQRVADYSLEQFDQALEKLA